MPAAATWTCGCGADVVAGERCPICGWEEAATGQPDRTPRRWVPLASAVLVATLAVDGVVAARGLGGVTAHRLDDDRQASVFLPPELLDDGSARTVPDDLGALLPAELAGWERLDAPELTGPLTLEELTAGLWEGAELTEGRAHLQTLGFVRAHSVAFLADGRLLGATVWEFNSPSGARQQLRDQATLVSIDRDVEPADVTLVDDAVAFTYEEQGDAAFEVWYRVDQFIVNEYVLAAEPVGEADLAVLHDAISERFGP